jgi:hypothetical protein
MRLKAEIWQTCRGTAQTKGKNPKPGKFFPRGPKWEEESSVAFFKLTHFKKK